jgi:hypothetical protein
MRHSTLTRPLVGLLLAGGLVAGLSATVLVPADLVDLVEGAQTVVYGRVAAVRSIRSDDRGTVTLVSLSVGGYLKGEGGRDVVFSVPGGEVGRYRTIVVGAPAFREGDEVVCFLKGQPPEIPSLVGFSQGVLKVYAGSAGERRVIAPPVRQPQPEKVVRGDAYQRMVTLDQFTLQVRDIERLRLERERGRSSSQAPRKLYQEPR